MRRTALALTTAAVLTLGLAACSGGDAERTSTATASAPSSAASSAAAGHDHGVSSSSSSSAVASATTPTTLAASGSSTPGPLAAATDSKAADVMFVQMMIPHHAQALDLADFALQGHQASPEVQALAKRIAAAQEPEITRMSQMLSRWGAEAGMDGHEMSMPGMLTEGELRGVAGLQGDAFDEEWISLMTAHHEGAVSMAQDVLKTTKDAQVKALAQGIITAQQREIAEMAALVEG